MTLNGKVTFKDGYQIEAHTISYVMMYSGKLLSNVGHSKIVDRNAILCYTAIVGKILVIYGTKKYGGGFNKHQMLFVYHYIT